MAPTSRFYDLEKKCKEIMEKHPANFWLINGFVLVFLGLNTSIIYSWSVVCVLHGCYGLADTLHNIS